MKKLIKHLKQVAIDTLKRDGKWSRTSLTMASAWFAILLTYFIDFYMNGFNEMAFTELLAVALGAKWVDAKSKEIEKR